VKYEEWEQGVPPDLTGDPLWRMKVYRLALFAGDLAWNDVSRLVKDGRMVSLADQLCRAVGSIAANIAEGYSRQSPRDQARFYEYALGSTREARVWYYQGRHVMSDQVSSHRLNLLTEIVRLLLAIVPRTRASRLADATAPYDVDLSALLDDPPDSE